jgi:hypothetical protein
MRRKFWMFVLGVGAVSGFAWGIHAWRWHAGACCGGRAGYGLAGSHAAFEDRVADVCTRAAARIYRDRDGAPPRAPAP